MHRLVALSLLVFPRIAAACSLMAPTEFTVLTDSTVDTVPPGEPGGPAEVTASRAHFSGSSCDDLGFIELVFTPSEEEPAVDDGENAGSNLPGVGYRLELAGGALPAGLELSKRAVYASRADDGKANLNLAWIDAEPSTPLDLSLDVVPVDLAGQEGEPLRVEVTDPGCSTAARTPALGLVAGALLGLRRREKKENQGRGRRGFGRGPPHPPGCPNVYGFAHTRIQLASATSMK